MAPLVAVLIPNYNEIENVKRESCRYSFLPQKTKVYLKSSFPMMAPSTAALL